MNEFITHLALLGYGPNDTVCIRALGKTAKNFTLKRDQLINNAAIKARVKEGASITFIPNPGGHKDADIKECRSIYYEHDNLPKEKSAALWQSLGLPEPSFQVDSGNKSIHSYWVLDDAISVNKWRSLQSDLLAYADGDNALKPPSHPMKIAGHPHPKTGNNVTISLKTDNRYSYDQLRNIIPQAKRQTWAEFLQQFKLPTFDAIPLEKCLSKAHRELIELGAKADRNNSGAALARDLIGAETYLQSQSQRIKDSAYTLFLEYCRKCNGGDGWDENEWKSIWKSAQKDNPKPCLSPDKILTCVAAHQWQNLTGEAVTVVDIADSKAREAVNSIRWKIESLLTRIGANEINQFTAVSELVEFCRANHYDIPSSKQLFQDEYRRFEELSDEDSDAGSAANYDGDSLPLDEVLPIQLAGAIESAANALPIQPEALLTTFLPTVASLIGTRSNVEIRKGWTQPSVIWGGIVGKPGDRKTAAFNIIQSPLRRLQAKEHETYVNLKKDYEAKLAAQKKKGKPEPNAPEPEPIGDPPQERQYYASDVTTESLTRILTEDASKGQTLLAFDELSGLFKSFGQYKGGGGSDRQIFLSLYGGADIKVDRKGADTLFRESTAASIAGGIQDDVLAKLMEETDGDSDGMWGRFLFTCIRRRKSTERGPEADISDTLANLYKRLDNLPEKNYKLSSSARKVFYAYEQEIENRMDAHGCGYQNVLSKMIGYTARLALILHCIDVALGVNKYDYIDAATLIRAVKLSEYYLGQALMLNQQTDTWNEKNPTYTKVLRICHQDDNNAITAAKASKHRIIKNASEAKELFERMAGDGLGTVTRGSRGGYVFTANQTNPANAANADRGRIVANLETLAGLRVQPLVSQIAENSDFEKQPPECIGMIQNEGVTSETPESCDFVTLSPEPTQDAGSGGRTLATLCDPCESSDIGGSPQLSHALGNKNEDREIDDGIENI